MIPQRGKSSSDVGVSFVVGGFMIGIMLSLLLDLNADETPVWEIVCLGLMGGFCGYAEAVYRRKL